MDLLSLLTVGRQEWSLARVTYQCTCRPGLSDKRTVGARLRKIILCLTIPGHTCSTGCLVYRSTLCKVALFCTGQQNDVNVPAFLGPRNGITGVGEAERFLLALDSLDLLVHLL